MTAKVLTRAKIQGTPQCQFNTNLATVITPETICLGDTEWATVTLSLASAQPVVLAPAKRPPVAQDLCRLFIRHCHQQPVQVGPMVPADGLGHWAGKWETIPLVPISQAQDAPTPALETTPVAISPATPNRLLGPASDFWPTAGLGLASPIMPVDYPLDLELALATTPTHSPLGPVFTFRPDVNFGTVPQASDEDDWDPLAMFWPSVTRPSGPLASGPVPPSTPPRQVGSRPLPVGLPPPLVALDRSQVPSHPPEDDVVGPTYPSLQYVPTPYPEEMGDQALDELFAAVNEQQLVQRTVNWAADRLQEVQDTYMCTSIGPDPDLVGEYDPATDPTGSILANINLWFQLEEMALDAKLAWEAKLVVAKKKVAVLQTAQPV
ncbi:hypothetical protein IWQ60_004239 [Tieghemiomyces parasiticus]|uniref:Uncharacterized protein n=1 Tax=Tieghemiomyces parasiticus TaxID=78921 RepID=A0A9W8A8Q7_9FUNG|nr:hypothetical protein IWQ60_004239 [Tieghemiomyces parasiticus]